MKGKIVMLCAGIFMLLASASASAAGRGCSFKKTLKQSGYVFDVSSRPANGCAIQVIEVVVRRGAKPFARFKTDVDFLAESAWIADLNGDGRPELAVASKSVKDDGRGTFDVYWLEENVLHRAALSKNEEGAGYQGHDSFSLAGSRIVRSFPVYRDGDPPARPSGGTRTLQYTFRDGRLELDGNKDEFATTASDAISEPLLYPQAAPGPVPAGTSSTIMPGKPVIDGIVSGSPLIELPQRKTGSELSLHASDKAVSP